MGKKNMTALQSVGFKKQSSKSIQDMCILNFSGVSGYTDSATSTSLSDLSNEVSSFDTLINCYPKLRVARAPSSNTTILEEDLIQQIEVCVSESETTPTEQSPANILLEEKWTSYLQLLTTTSDENVNGFVLNGIKKVREQLASTLEAYLKPPKASPSDEGGISLSWTFGDYFVSIDVLTEGTIEWFLRNRKSGEYFGDTGCDIDDFPPLSFRKHLVQIKKIL